MTKKEKIMLAAYELNLLENLKISNKKLIEEADKELPFANKHQAAWMLSQLDYDGVIKCSGGFSRIL